MGLNRRIEGEVYSSVEEDMKVEGRKMLTARKRGKRAERNYRLKKAVSLRTRNEPEGISAPADQQCISRIWSTGRMDRLCRSR